MYLEVFSNGYIEFGNIIDSNGGYGTHISDRVEIPMIVNFTRLIQSVYEQYSSLTPLMLSLSIFNAKSIWLAVSSNMNESIRVKWQEQHLELEKFYTDNISGERELLTKAICDRLWQAFHREKCNLFDDAGLFRVPR